MRRKGGQGEIESRESQVSLLNLESNRGLATV